MDREHSHIRKRKKRRGCLSGCLVNVVLFLGVLALLFVGACTIGVVQNDPETGAPYISFNNIHFGDFSLADLTLPSIELPEFKMPDVQLLSWPYGMETGGLTVKTLRAGDGEAILVCCDGYTMLLGAGDGSGLTLAAQLLLCGVNDLSVAAATQSSDVRIGGMKAVVEHFKPEYLLYSDTQVKGSAYHAMIDAAQKADGLICIAPTRGVTFSLGRSTVTVLGPVHTGHTDDRDDGLTIRIDYGGTSVLVAGGITANGEQDLIRAGANLAADVVICSGTGEGSGAQFVQAVSPKYALLTAKTPENAVKVRYQRAAAEIYTMAEHGVMTVKSNGQTIRVEP